MQREIRAVLRNVEYMNVGARKLQANWLTLQTYCVVHNYAKLLNYANVLRARMQNALGHHSIILGSATNSAYGTISKDMSII